MSKPWTPTRPTVDLHAPSRIRREPPPVDKQTRLPDDSENETWAVVIGMMTFAIALTVLIFWISDKTSPGSQPAPIVVISES
ncbi:MAG TPA: hypothetical protein VGB39_07920 [Sphingomicrobium sp.]